MWLIQWAKTNTWKNEFGVPIRNFAKVTDTLYRGALPHAAGYRALAEQMGIRRVLSMTGANRPQDGETALANGIEEWLRVPFGDRETPDDDKVREWLAIVRTAPERGAIYTHCMGGRHRTGTLIAAFRVTDCGWTKEQAFAEMMRYGWYDALGHRPLRDWFFQIFDPKDFAQPSAPEMGRELTGLAQGGEG